MHWFSQPNQLWFIRRRYEKGHWDSVIIDFKEIELGEQAPALESIFERIRKELEPYKPPQATWLPCHAIDLHKDGELNAHVDSVRFSGDLVAGLSLLSPSIMRLKPDATSNDDPLEGHVDLWLPTRSLYVLSGMSRYSYTHELLPSQATFRDNTVERNRRISIIFRDAKVGCLLSEESCLFWFEYPSLLSLMINAYHWNYRLTHMKRILRLEWSVINFAFCFCVMMLFLTFLFF